MYICVSEIKFRNKLFFFSSLQLSHLKPPKSFRWVDTDDTDNPTVSILIWKFHIIEVLM